MENMYLALDIGEKRIGIAVGSVIPFGRGTVEALDNDAVVEHIRNIIHTDHVNACVVGMPYVKSGLITNSQKLALQWIDRLKNEFGLPVETVDETLTSREAERQLREEGVDTSANPHRIDERAAEIILAQYIAHHKHG